MSSCCQENPNCPKHATRSLIIALAGNPNCGKTTLFNRLTGARQKVGNWPGVTVERKSGYFQYQQTRIEVIDLPGTYSLVQTEEAGALDEQIACDFLLEQRADIIINIIDATHLERHLYLTMQLIEMGVPLILVLNMMDIAHSRGIHIDVTALSKALHCPVIALEAHKGQGLTELKEAICHYSQSKSRFSLSYPPALQHAISQLTTEVGHPWFAIRLLENDRQMERLLPTTVWQQAKNLQTTIQNQLQEEADILLADARYQEIGRLVALSSSTTPINKTSWTTRIDNIVLNRFLGIPIFLGMMYLLFVFAINIGGAFQDFFDMSSQAIFVDGFAAGLTAMGAPTWLIALLANGIGKGINTTVTFIPVIGALFLFLSLLEDSGYMARAAFVIDRGMRVLGLPGKAFVPMIVGFGCNVPAIMSARTLENKRDRILTIMMSPFMSCGARLAIFAVFTAAFFPHGGQNWVFALYLIGIVIAMLTGWLLRTTALKGEPSPFIMEMPLYHLPHAKTLFLHMWQRLKAFIYRAGKLIVPICVVIGALNTLNIDGTLNTGEGDVHSLLSFVGQWSTPLFAPMGIQPDNWPATVGLVTGILAKEVVVGTLNTLYTQVGHFAVMSPDQFHLGQALYAAFASIADNLSALGNAFIHPFAPDAPIVNAGVYGIMAERFDGKAGAFAYLLFILLYFPCVSTMAAMLRELHRGWSIFSAVWMTGVAYGVAVIFYQAATFAAHPLASSLWIGGLLAILGVTIAVMRWYSNTPSKSHDKEKQYEPA